MANELPPLPAPAHRITGKLGHLVSFESTTVSKGDAILTVAEAEAYARAAVLAERERFKADAESWGDALNEAAWAHIDAYRTHMGEPESARYFNMCKTVLRDSILAYLKVCAAAIRARSTP